jgi:hypothetical protein
VRVALAAWLRLCVMRWGHLGIVGAAVLLALHVDLSAGVDLGHPHVLLTAPILDQQQARQAPTVTRPSRVPSMTVACLAMLAGLLLLHATSPATWRRRQLLVVMPPAAPVSTPPTPPPITLGVSRS